MVVDELRQPAVAGVGVGTPCPGDADESTVGEGMAGGDGVGDLVAAGWIDGGPVAGNEGSGAVGLVTASGDADC